MKIREKIPLTYSERFKLPQKLKCNEVKKSEGKILLQMVYKLPSKTILRLYSMRVLQDWEKWGYSGYFLFSGKMIQSTLIPVKRKRL